MPCWSWRYCPFNTTGIVPLPAFSGKAVQLMQKQFITSSWVRWGFTTLDGSWGSLSIILSRLRYTYTLIETLFSQWGYKYASVRKPMGDKNTFCATEYVGKNKHWANLLINYLYWFLHSLGFQKKINYKKKKIKIVWGFYFLSLFFFFFLVPTLTLLMNFKFNWYFMIHHWYIMQKGKVQHW